MAQIKLFRGIATEKVDDHNYADKFREARKTESRTDQSTVKLTATQKMAVKKAAEDLGVGCSTFIEQALELYFEVYPYASKFQRHKNLILSFLEGLS